MRWTSTTERYGTVAIAMHWLTALAVVGLLVSGTLMEDMAGDEKVSVLRIHAIMGSTILLLTLLRLAWWWLVDTRPEPAAGMPRWQERAARATHGLLYLLLVVMGASGIAMIVLSGAGPILLGGPGSLPAFGELPPRAAHGLAANVLIVFAGLHVAAALYHQFVRRDRLLARMGIGAR